MHVVEKKPCGSQEALLPYVCVYIYIYIYIYISSGFPRTINGARNARPLIANLQGILLGFRVSGVAMEPLHGTTLA